MNKHIKKWSEKLLDLTKRNNLISFKDSKGATIETVYPSVSNIFSSLLDEKTLTVYNDEVLENNIDENGEEIKITKEEYVETYSKNLKKDEVLLYKETSISKKILKNISKKNSEFFQEKGLNITHMTFGFLKWKEDDNSEILYKAPILLIPVSIESKSSVDEYTIKRLDDVILNPTFKYKLKSEHNIDLEDYNNSDSLETYLEYVESKVFKLGWSIIVESKICNLPFSKISMYIDLIENQNIILNNPIIQSLTGTIEQEYSEDSEVAIKNHSQINVVSADASQCSGR